MRQVVTEPQPVRHVLCVRPAIAVANGDLSLGQGRITPKILFDGVVGVVATLSLREVIVPLSEHEQRLLEQMEQQLSVEDPKFASAMRGSVARAKARRRIILGALGVLVGLALVLLGVAQGIVARRHRRLRASWWPEPGWRSLRSGARARSARSLPTARPSRTSPHRRAGRRPGAKGVEAARPGAGSTSAARSCPRIEQRWERRRDEGWGA